MTNTRGAKQAKKKTQLLKSQSSNTKIKTNWGTKVKPKFSILFLESKDKASIFNSQQEWKQLLWGHHLKLKTL
jgi:hypothetical protein